MRLVVRRLTQHEFVHIAGASIKAGRPIHERNLMPIELIIATVAISLALLFYTWGVFGERRHGSLSLKYVLLFWAGLTATQRAPSS